MPGPLPEAPPAQPVPAPQPAPPAPAGAPAAAQVPAGTDPLAELEAELDASNAEIAAAESAAMLPSDWPDLTGVDLLASIRDVEPPEDRPVPVLLDRFQVTLFKLPPSEPVVDIVIGDPLYFETSGEGTEVYVKPMQVPRRTSLLLTTRGGADYSFDLFATAAYAPDVQVRLRSSRPVDEEPVRRRPDFRLRFGTLGDLRAQRAEAAALRSRIGDVEQDATARIADIDSARLARMRTAQQRYAESIEQRYWMSPELSAPPLLVSQIWTDGQFTFLRSTAQEAPALYALAGEDADEPVLVNYELNPEGLYVVDHVMSAGWAQLGDIRGEWGLWERPDLDRLSDLSLPVRPGAPDLAPPEPVGRAAPGRGFWSSRPGRVISVALVATLGYGLWRSIDV